MPNSILKHFPNWFLGLGLIAVALVVAVQMYRGEALVCADGAIFHKKCSTYPKGAVVAFYTTECPKGWNSFNQAHARVIVGAGDPKESPDGLGKDANGDLTTYHLGNFGGTEKHKLTEEEMPKHKHNVIGIEQDGSTGVREWGHTINGNGHSRRIDVDDGRPYRREGTNIEIKGKLVTMDAGQNSLHNNMPPYFSLLYCVK